MKESQLEELKQDLGNALRYDITKPQTVSDADRTLYKLRKLIERSLEAVSYFIEERNERLNDHEEVFD